MYSMESSCETLCPSISMLISHTIMSFITMMQVGCRYSVTRSLELLLMYCRSVALAHNPVGHWQQQQEPEENHSCVAQGPGTELSSSGQQCNDNTKGPLCGMAADNRKTCQWSFAVPLVTGPAASGRWSIRAASAARRGPRLRAAK